MENQEKTAGELRKEFYGYLVTEGFVLTTERHNIIKAFLNEYKEIGIRICQKSLEKRSFPQKKPKPPKPPKPPEPPKDYKPSPPPFQKNPENSRQPYIHGSKSSLWTPHEGDDKEWINRNLN